MLLLLLVLLPFNPAILRCSRCKHGSDKGGGEGRGGVHGRLCPCLLLGISRSCCAEFVTPGATSTKLRIPVGLGMLHRWCVTGTPVGSDIADLKGQFHFLQLHPFTNKNFFNSYVKPAYSGSGWARSPAYVPLYMLAQCMIRHTKLQVRSQLQDSWQKAD